MCPAVIVGETAGGIARLKGRSARGTSVVEIVSPDRASVSSPEAGNWKPGKICVGEELLCGGSPDRVFHFVQAFAVGIPGVFPDITGKIILFLLLIKTSSHVRKQKRIS